MNGNRTGIKSVLIYGTNRTELESLCNDLTVEGMDASGCWTLSELESRLVKGGPRVVIVDLDNALVDNRFFRALKKKARGFALSAFPADRFTPNSRRPCATTSTPACANRWTRMSWSFS